MWSRRALRACEILGTLHPIIQAPMAGVTTPALVASVSKANGLGSLPAGYSPPEKFLADIIATQALLTNQEPFSANLFVPAVENETGSVEQRQRMNGALNRYRQQLGLPPVPELVIPAASSLDVMIDIIIERNIPIVSFTFGIITPEQIQRLKSRNILLIGTATTVNEAKAVEAAGCDMVVAQGYEAGGHRGTFLKSSGTSLIGTMALVPQVVDAVGIPVIAAGGIMDGRGIAAAFQLDAHAVQMGTAFLRSHEAGTPKVHKDALARCDENSTKLTTAFSGKLARGIINEFMEEIEKHHEKDVLPYPDQHYATAPLRQHAAKCQHHQFMSLWAGQGAKLCKELPAGELVKMFAEQALQLLAPSGAKHKV